MRMRTSREAAWPAEAARGHNGRSPESQIGTTSSAPDTRLRSGRWSGIDDPAECRCSGTSASVVPDQLHLMGCPVSARSPFGRRRGRSLTLESMNLDEVSWIRGEWDSGPEEPIILHSALNAERFEVRKLEEFRDGRVGFAGEFARSVLTELGTEAVPPIDEINTSSELEVVSISRAELDKAWFSAIRAAAEGDELFRCRCCGVRGLQEPALGTCEICSSCGWEDDPVQSRDPTSEGGANGSRLITQRQENLEHLLQQQQQWDSGEGPGVSSRLFCVGRRSGLALCGYGSGRGLAPVRRFDRIRRDAARWRGCRGYRSQLVVGASSATGLNRLAVVDAPPTA